MDSILKILDKEQGMIDVAKIARELGKSADEVATQIKEFEKNHIIVGYKTIVNWEKTDRDVVTALIDLRVTPQRGEGFDKVAERIYKYPQVRSLYLMSGAYDLHLVIEGRTMREVSQFVAAKLASLESILSTSTHFVLKKYKDKGVIYGTDNQDERGNCMI